VGLGLLAAVQKAGLGYQCVGVLRYEAWMYGA
jgi:hypothetical protein